MVAYSFQKQFAPKIIDRSKTHTIRGPRKRHAKPGENLQLYTGMRTKHCRKIIDDPVCTFVSPIRITFASSRIIDIWFGPAGGDQHDILLDHYDEFAKMDGFNCAASMAAFWDIENLVPVQGTVAFEFYGFMIGWGKHPLSVLYPKLEFTL